MTFIQQNLLQTVDFIGNNWNQKIILLIPTYSVSRTNEKEKNNIFSSQHTENFSSGFFFFHLGNWTVSYETFCYAKQSV